MKKILSLLSVITITGTVTLSVITNDNFQKYKEIKTNGFKTNKLNRIKRETKFNENGQITFDIGSIYTNRNILVNKPSSWGITGNNPPSNWEIISGLRVANSFSNLSLNNNDVGFQSIRNQNILYISDFLNVSHASRNSAYINAKQNTPFTGGFWVYY